MSEVQALQAAVSVCKKAQASLVRVTACFQQLVLSVGGSSDCSRLREELEETRLRAHQISTGTALLVLTSLHCRALVLGVTFSWFHTQPH